MRLKAHSRAESLSTDSAFGNQQSRNQFVIEVPNPLCGAKSARFQVCGELYNGMLCHEAKRGVFPVTLGVGIAETSTQAGENMSDHSLGLSHNILLQGTKETVSELEQHLFI